MGCDSISLICTEVSEDPPASIFRIDSYTYVVHLPSEYFSTLLMHISVCPETSAHIGLYETSRRHMPGTNSIPSH